MPNIGILSTFTESVVLEAIQASNRMKIERDAQRKGAEEVSKFLEGAEKIAV
jgi:hypothetical protein